MSLKRLFARALFIASGLVVALAHAGAVRLHLARACAPRLADGPLGAGIQPIGVGFLTLAAAIVLIAILLAAIGRSDAPRLARQAAAFGASLGLFGVTWTAATAVLRACA